MFERVDFIVLRIDGDYAYLVKKEEQDGEERCVARAILPPEIYEGCTLAYEMMSYEMAD